MPRGAGLRWGRAMTEPALPQDPVCRNGPFAIVPSTGDKTVRIPSFPHEQPPTIGRRTLLQTAAALALGLGPAAQPASAATFPTKPVKLVVAYPAGGATDIVARLLVGPLQQIWGQPVVVENITGASGILGAQAVQRAAPDGHTLLITISNTHAVLPHMQALPFDPFKDFTAVTNLVNAQSGVFVRRDVPVTDLPEFFQYARQRGEPLAFGDWGLGSLGHMISASLALDQGFRVNPIHYRGASPVIVAALGGEIAVGSSDVSTTLPHHKAGKLRMLALNGTSRHPAAKDVPTFSEFGIHDFDSYSWIAMFAPAGTPLALRQDIAQALQRVTLAPEMRERLTERGFLPAPSSPEQFEAEWRSTYARFGKLIQKTGIRAE